MKKTKRKNPSADGITGPPAVVRKIVHKSSQVLTKAEMMHMLNATRSVLIKMMEYVESVADDTKKTRQLVQQLHSWDKLRPHASNFNRVLQQEAEAAEVRRLEKERREE